MYLLISSVIANIVLEKLEETCINTLHKKPTTYKQYVDDIFLIHDKDAIENLTKTFNNFHKKLKFTIEKEVNNTIHSLDVSVIKNITTNKIITN